MRYLSSVYFVNQPLPVSDIFVAHHQEVYCIYTKIGTCCAVQLTVCWKRQSTGKHNTYKLLYTGCPRRNVPDFGRVFLMLKYTDITQNTYDQS
jgi:hypothetical protein